MHWLSKGRSGCLHVPWCSEGLLVMCFAVGGGCFFLGWILNCRVTWKCIYTCLLLSTCVVFVLGLVLLRSMSLSPPLLPIYSQVASPFHLRLLASCTWFIWLISPILLTNGLIFNWKWGHTWIWFIPFTSLSAQYYHYSFSHHCNLFQTWWIFLINSSLFRIWPYFLCEV